MMTQFRTYAVVPAIVWLLLTANQPVMFKVKGRV
jgi:hypothetical protein